MSIVATEILSDTGSSPRVLHYRCQDHLGVWHMVGPIFTNESFDASAYKVTAADKVALRLAEFEVEELLQ